HYLSSVGYEIVTATSVLLARDALTQMRFDLLVLEANLADGDGFVLCHEVRELLGDGIVIVFVSASNTPRDRIVGLQLGADDYLGKPYSQDELKARIAVGRRRRQFMSMG